MNAVKRTDAGRWLRVAGLRKQIHPNDTLAYVYPDAATFEEYKTRNEALGNVTWGPYMTPEGVVGIVDYRPQLAVKHIPNTDPAMPDEGWPE